MEYGNVASVTWELSSNAKMGRVGLSSRLRTDLENAGVEIMIIEQWINIKYLVTPKHPSRQRVFCQF